MSENEIQCESEFERRCRVQREYELRIKMEAAFWASIYPELAKNDNLVAHLPMHPFFGR